MKFVRELISIHDNQILMNRPSHSRFLCVSTKHYSSNANVCTLMKPWEEYWQEPLKASILTSCEYANRTPDQIKENNDSNIRTMFGWNQTTNKLIYRQHHVGPISNLRSHDRHSRANPIRIGTEHTCSVADCTPRSSCRRNTINRRTIMNQCAISSAAQKAAAPHTAVTTCCRLLRKPDRD